MEWITAVPIAEITGPTAVVLVALLVITDKLVWHTRLDKAEKQWGSRLEKAEEQRDRWERVALDALTAAERLTVHAEVTNAVLTAAPPQTSQGSDSP